MGNKPTVIFEVGASNIKLVETAFNKDRIKLTNFSIIPIAGETFKIGTMLDADNAADLIAKELRRKGFKAKTARGVVSGEGIISRDILTSKVSPQELDNMIKFESSQYFPVDISSYAVDYKVISEVKTSEGLKYKVYIVAVPQRIIDSYARIAAKCKLMLEIIDINGNAFSKLLELEAKARAEAYGADDVLVGVDIGAASSYIVFNQKGSFQFGREVRFGVNDINRIFAEYLGLDKKKAEEVLITKGENYLYINEDDTSLDEEIRVIGKDIGKIMREFALELNKIIEFYQLRYEGKNIKKVYLTGGGSNIKGIDEFLTKSINLECSKLGELKCVSSTAKGDFKNSAMFLTNAIGTTIRSK